VGRRRSPLQLALSLTGTVHLVALPSWQDLADLAYLAAHPTLTCCLSQMAQGRLKDSRHSTGISEGARLRELLFRLFALAQLTS
jgi:hypothetical protein